MDSSPSALIKLNMDLRNHAAPMQMLWQEVGRMCLTRKVQSLINAYNKASTTTELWQPDTRLLNSRAVQANEILSAGIMSVIMPSDQRWFSFKPAPSQRGNDALEEWLEACTEIALLEMFVAGFYPRVHESMEDRCTFGTNILHVDSGVKNALRFRSWDAGTYVIAENEDGECDLVFREREWTARQALQEFDQLPPVVQQQLKNNKLDEKTKYIHCIFPRDLKAVDENAGPKGKAFASIYIHEPTQMIVKESGFDELPSFASRYRKWSEASAYGVSPAMIALAEIRGVNYLEMLMSTLAEVTVNPRMILPQGFQGVPDLRAGGITFGGLSRDTFPQEWMTGGRFDIGLNLMERKERAIDDAFHRPLFDQFSQMDREITATEVRARQAEKLARFSPAFTSLTVEFINPIMERVFMLLYRAGKFPAPPQEAFMADALGRPMLLFPSIVQTNRMAQSMALARQSEFAAIFQLLAPLQQLGSPVLDNLDDEQMTRDMIRDAALPTRDLDSVKALRDARAQAQQAQQQMEMAQAAMKSGPAMDMAQQALGGQQKAA